MLKVFDEQTADKLLRINKVISGSEFMRGESDMGRVVDFAMRDCRHQIAEEITKKFFVFERMAISDCVVVKGACYVLTPEEYRDALVRAYQKGKDVALRFDPFRAG